MWESIKEWLAIGWDWLIMIFTGLLILAVVIIGFIDWYKWVSEENHKPTTAGVEILEWLVEMWNSFKVKIAWLKKSEGDLINNIAKALLVGIISGLLIGFTGEVWTFVVYLFTSGYPTYKYDTTLAIIGGVLATLALFLVYNKKD